MQRRRQTLKASQAMENPEAPLQKWKPFGATGNPEAPPSQKLEPFSSDLQVLGFT
jgi:hypothetical protein